MSSKGDKVKDISSKLHKNEHTVRSIIKKYNKYGFIGLMKVKQTGRPSEKRKNIIHFIEKVLCNHPEEYGYAHQTWTNKLILAHYNSEYNKNVSGSTVRRGLKDAGFSYKRPISQCQLSHQVKRKKLFLLIKLLKM